MNHFHRVVKNARTLKDRELRPQFEALLRNLLERVPFLKLKSLKAEGLLSGNHSGETERPDWLADVRAKDQHWTLLVECRRLGQPREVRVAILQLKHFLEQLPANKPGYGVLVAPFISEESARLCEDAGIGYADLAGNARLSFDQVFIETRSAENPFRERREARSIFAPKAARVLRVLLQGPLRPWKVVELADAARVSLGWVSAVRQQLFAREWAVDEPGGLRVSKPAALLDAWAKADDWEKRTTTREYSLLSSEPTQLAEKFRDLLGKQPHAFTQWFAGWLRHPYTVPTVVTAYVTSFPEEAAIIEKLLARRVSGAGGLRLVVPKDEGVLNPSQSVRGFNLVSDVQIYLDLQHAGLRGEEQGAELRKWPDFAGGWA
jgi:hypothetical protein